MRIKQKSQNKLDNYIGKFVSRNSGFMKGINGRLTKNSEGYWILYFDGSSCKVNESMVDFGE